MSLLVDDRCDDDATLAELFMLGQVERLGQERERCEGSLIEFFRGAWPEMGETAQLSINWHHKALAEKLEALAYGEIRDLIVNIPPRHSKIAACERRVSSLALDTGA